MSGRKDRGTRNAHPGVGRRRARYPASDALTLIELLVAVAIVAILAGAILPSLLLFQTRAKVAASKNSLRVLANAIDVYYLDYQSHPFPQASVDDPFGVISRKALNCLTTPVAYVSPDAFHDSFGALKIQVPLLPTDVRNLGDPFRPPTPGFNTDQSILYFYYPKLASLLVEPVPKGGAFAVVSVGPDLKDSFMLYYPFPRSLPQGAASYGVRSIADSVYDPTNGTISGGDLGAFGGALSVRRIVGGGD